jgi:hypothetical protein
MKLFIGTTLLLLLAGGPVFAGQEPDKDKPKEEPKKQEEPKKAPRTAEKPKQEPVRQQEENKDRAKQEEERKTPPPKAAQRDDRAQEQQRAKQTEQHSDRNAHEERRRVPEATFRVSFGSAHHFHVERRDDRRFNYGGYWFVYNEPWPGDWDYNDDVYIEDVDGEYYLLNPRHPGVRLLVIVGD